MITVNFIRKEQLKLTTHQKKQFKRYLLDALAGLVFILLQKEYPVVSVIIFVIMVLLPLDPDRLDVHDEKGRISFDYIRIRAMYLIGVPLFLYFLMRLCTHGAVSP